MVFPIKMFSQESNTIGTVTEIVSPLIPSNIKNNSLNLSEDDEVKNFLEELENSDTKVLKLTEKANNSEEIIYNEDNVTKGINIFGEEEMNQLLEELSNNNALFDEEREEITTFDNNNVNVLGSNNSIEEQNDIISSSFPMVKASPLEKVQISSIGLNNIEIIPSNLSVWNNISFQRANYLLENANYVFDSVSLRKIMKEVISSSQEAPKGTLELEKQFILNKLMLLANLNELETLYKLIDLLPNDKEFDIWRSLRVKHALIKGEFESDSLACKIVNDVSMTNFEDFWKMSQIFCQLIQGNEDDALFDAELLRASGGGDEEFFDLLGLMIGESETPLIDGEKINLLHVAMMDQLRNVVPNDFVTRTPYYNYNILLKVENIQPSTKAFILDKLIEFNKISKEEIETYYNAFGDKSIILTEALSNLKKNRGPQSRADVWNSIKNELDNENINKSILEVIAIEAQSGRPLQALNLYSDLLLDSDNSTDEHDAIIRKFKFINGINKNKTFFKNTYPEVKFLSDLLSLSPDNIISIKKLDEHYISDIIPVLSLFDIEINENDFLSLYLDRGETYPTYQFCCEKNDKTLLSLALERAYKERKFAEVIFIQSLILKDKNLHNVSVNLIYGLVASLISFELNEFAKDLVREWLAARIINNLSRSYLKENMIILDEEKVRVYDSLFN